MCPYCAEQVKTTAKICPWCRQWLSLFSLRNPSTFAMAFYLCLLIFSIGFLLFFHRLVGPGTDFSSYRDGISVIESRMSFATEEKDPKVYVIAVITNQTEMAWKNIQLDTRFFDKSGTLIDARTYSDNARILPHEDLAVRITTKPSHALSDYQSCKVFIRCARDARSILSW